MKLREGNDCRPLAPSPSRYFAEDDCGRVSKKFIEREILPTLADLPLDMRGEYERELNQMGRFEITVVHEGGQYADVLRKGGNQQTAISSYVRARLASYRFLAQVPAQARHTVLLAAVAYCYTLGKQDDDAHFSDNCVWQLGAKRPTGGREFGIAQAFYLRPARNRTAWPTCLDQPRRSSELPNRQTPSCRHPSHPKWHLV